jgi:hypothetical protein
MAATPNHVVPTRVSSYGIKFRLATSTVKAAHVDDLPGWENVKLCTVDTWRVWPSGVGKAPMWVAGNALAGEGEFKLRKDSLNVLDWAWHCGHEVHRHKYGRYSSNPRWGLLVVEFVGLIDGKIEQELRAALRQVRATV